MLELSSSALFPQGGSVNEEHPMAKVLQYAWTGDGTERIQRVNGGGIYSGASRQGTPFGLAITSTGTLTGSTYTPAKPISAFPYTQIAFGYLSSAGGSWTLSWLSSSAGGTASQIYLASSTVIRLGLRYAFAAPLQTLDVTLATTVNVPICAITNIYSTTDYRMWVNGRTNSGTTSTGAITTLNRMVNVGEQLNGGSIFSGWGQGAVLDEDYAAWASANPWKGFKGFIKKRIWVPVSAGGNVNVALSGVAVTSSIGTLGLANTVALTGSGITSSIGTLVPSLSVLLTGTAVSTATGSIIPSITIGLLGISATVSTGTVSASGAAGATLSGYEATVSLVALGVTITLPLSGTAASIALGTLSPTTGSALITIEAGSWIRYRKIP